MWLNEPSTERTSISERKEGYHGRQRREKRQRQSAKTESRTTEKKGQEEIVKVLSSREVVGFA
jgi:hypothetical protein